MQHISAYNFCSFKRNLNRSLWFLLKGTGTTAVFNFVKVTIIMMSIYKKPYINKGSLVYNKT